MVRESNAIQGERDKAPAGKSLQACHMHAACAAKTAVPGRYLRCTRRGMGDGRAHDNRCLTGRAMLFGCIIAWQCYTCVRLGIYASHLSEGRDRHAELQESLQATQAKLVQLRNSTERCATSESDHALALAAANRLRSTVQIRLEEVLELNAWLNQTAVAREAALHDESNRRQQAEASVMGIREQMNLLKGQLVTAQQQQGTLHSAQHGRKGGRH